MIRSFYILIFLSGLSFMAIFLSGCSGKPSDSRAEYEEQYLVRVGESTATLFDFNKALEIAETAYPYNLLQNPDIFRKIQMRTLQQIIEEKLLQETARDLNIVLSDSEVEKVVSEMKSD
ncbi:MAG TPA: hypothetical protein ENG35_06135, partial [Desulfobacteraceae bacterium]|nr:hypothetical protein [Desulfobacteraceae bacterium]